MVIVVAVVTGLQPPPTVEAALLALALVPGASLLLFLMSYALGLLGFWHSSVWQLGALLGMLLGLFSGSFIPLWFFPDWLLAVSEYLPFRLLYFAPSATWLGKIAAADAAWLIVVAVGVDRRAAGAAASAVAGRHPQGRGAGRVRR